MNRSEAVKVLKGVLDKCPSIEASSIILVPPRADDTFSHGYQIHLRTLLNQAERQCLEMFLFEQGLAFKETQGKTIIYRPLKKS